jgi:hypothetical protein
VGLAVGEPLYVEPNASGDALETARLELERRLAALEKDATSLLS